jgi:hypothetical protein
MNPPILAPDTPFRERWLKLLCALLLTFGIFTGCQTNKIDWSGRIGTYTYDDAIKEMGPPDKSATLTDGTMVCEWLTHRGGEGGTVVSSGFYGLYASSTPGSPDAFMRLTFNPEKKLTEAKRIYK